MAGKKNKSKTEKPPAIDKLLKPAIGIVLAFVGYYFMKGIDTDIPRIDVTDELALREVFFGEGAGNNHAVLCHTLPAEGSGKKPLPVSSVFQDAMDELVSANNPIASFSLMDCTYTLPSGKTIAEKFKLNLKKRPTIFVSGKVGSPKQIPDKHLKTGHMLVKVLKGMLEPHAAKIESTKDLKSKCLSKDVCALLLKGGTPQQFLKDAFKNLLTSYEDVQFASLDSATMLLTGLEEYLPEFESGKHRFVVFKKISGGMKAEDGRLITSMVPLAEDESISFSTMGTLVSDVKSGKSKAKKLSSLPQVKTRTKKLEAQMKEKRDRSNKKKETPKTTPSGSFSENDGSKEGRRAERERRRQEHRKNNPNYKESTPEEIAEREKRRRERMEQEAAKWNIGEADAPEEGEPIGDESGYDGFEEYDDEGYDTYEVDEEEEEDDEDVLDLD